jgi:NAD(P)-dependent dehydrogenase (short-subunit alcohol dehydrogenase family)
MSDWFLERSRLTGTVAVLAGGAGGLGRAIAEDLAANGVYLAVIDIDADAVEALARAHPDAVVHHGDARDPEALASLFAAVDDRWGRLDTLVNVVGGTFKADFVNTRPKGWDAVLRANLLTVLHGCLLAVPRMVAGGRGGSIINLTTIEAHRAAPGYAVYTAAKAAVEQFARTLAVELAPQGIRVNNVAPDFTPTPNILGGPDPGTHPLSHPVGSTIAIPMGRPGRPSDVSNCVVFLASGLSAYVTGTTLHPDGGAYASSGWFNWPDDGWSNFAPHSVLDQLTPSAGGE